MKVTTVGLDLAKQVFSVHGVDEHGKAVLRKRLSRGKLLEFFALSGTPAHLFPDRNAHTHKPPVTTIATQETHTGTSKPPTWTGH